MTVKYDFDYHPSFLNECHSMFKHCPTSDSDFKRFKKAINANLDLFNHELPKKYIKVPKKGHKIKYPVLNIDIFTVKKEMGKI